MVRGWMVCTKRAKTAAVSQGTSHVTTKRCKYITSAQIKTRYVELLSLTLNHTLPKRSESARERRIRYIKATIVVIIIIIIIIIITIPMWELSSAMLINLVT